MIKLSSNQLKTRVLPQTNGNVWKVSVYLHAIHQTYNIGADETPLSLILFLFRLTGCDHLLCLFNLLEMNDGYDVLFIFKIRIVSNQTVWSRILATRHVPVTITRPTPEFLETFFISHISLYFISVRNTFFIWSL